MAKLNIDTGPIEAGDSLDLVPASQWRELMFARRGFVAVKMPYDCRELLRFVDEAEKMHGPLGFASVDAFVREGLGLDPALVGWAIEGLRAMKPDEPIAFDAAVKKGMKVAAIAKVARPLGPAKPVPGSPSRNPLGRGNGIKRDNIPLDNNRGTSAAHLTARIARDAPAVHERMKAGEFPSVRAAAIEAGVVKPPDPIKVAVLAFRRLKGKQVAAFKREVGWAT